MRRSSVNGRSTKIVWDGEKDASMIKELGYTHSNFTGFMLDGRGRAGTGIQHSSFMFGTNLRYRHVAFLNMIGNGVSVGLPKAQGVWRQVRGVGNRRDGF